MKQRDIAFGLNLEQFRALAAGALIMLVQGSLYVFGTMTSYIYSYLFYKGSTSLQINDLQIIVTISVLCVNVGMLVPKIKMLNFSNRITALISIIGVVLSVFLVSFSQSFFLYILIYGICFGVSIGYGYVAPMKNCYEHIPDKKGLCSGVCIMGFGIGAFFFNFLLLQLINPDHIENNKQTHRCPEDVANNLPNALRIMSAVYLVVGLIGVFLISPKKESTEQQHKQSLIHNKESIQSQNALENTEQTQLLKKKDEILSLRDILIESTCTQQNKEKIIWLMAILGSTMPYGGFVAFYYKEYGLTQISSDVFFTVLGSVGSVMNGVARLFWGTMMDKISFKAITYILNALFFISCCCIYFAVHSEALYLIIILLTYCCYGGNFGIYPTQTMRILGAQNGGKYYWITFTGFGVGAVLQFLIHFLFVNILGKEGFKYCFIFFGILLIIGSIISYKINFEFHESELKYIKGLDLDGHKKIVSERQSKASQPTAVSE